MPPQQNQQPIQPQSQSNQPAVSPYPTQPSTLPIAQPPKKSGQSKILIGVIIFLVILLLSSIGFGIWAYAERNDYKENADVKIEEAVTVANEELTKQLEADFLEREKSPYKTYNGPAAFGSVKIVYPKTWAASIDEGGSSSVPLYGEFHPNFVPGEKSETALALKVEVLDDTYEDILDDYQSEAKKGEVRISPYTAPKVPDVLGSRVDGEVERDFQGSVVVFPLRDKTLRITTLSEQFVGDFNDPILANLEFTP